MTTPSKGSGAWFLFGLVSHLLLLLALYVLILSLPDSWRGGVLVQGHPGGAPWGAGPPAVREIRDYDAFVWCGMALTSVLASVTVVWLAWHRRRWFAIGFLIPVVWSLFYLFK